MRLEKFEIKPHEFKHPIVIEERRVKKDDDNIPIEDDWEAYITTRSKILNDRGSESGGNSSSYKTFFIRTRRDKPVTNLHRVLYKKIAYDIEYANDIDEAGIITEIKAKLVK